MQSANKKEFAEILLPVLKKIFSEYVDDLNKYETNLHKEMFNIPPAPPLTKWQRKWLKITDCYDVALYRLRRIKNIALGKEDWGDEW